MQNKFMQPPFIYQALLGAYFSLGLIFLLLAIGAKIIIKLFHLPIKKPIGIVILTIFFIYTAISGLFTWLYNLMAQKPPFPSFLELVWVSFIIVWCIGLWNLKRWGLIGLFISNVYLMVAPLINHTWTVLSLIFLLPLLIVLPSYKSFN